MTFRIGYLGYGIQIYGLDVFHWFVTINESHLLRGFEDEKAVWDSHREAKTAAFSFVQSLVEDEE